MYKLHKTPQTQINLKLMQAIQSLTGASQQNLYAFSEFGFDKWKHVQDQINKAKSEIQAAEAAFTLWAMHEKKENR